MALLKGRVLSLQGRWVMVGMTVEGLHPGHGIAQVQDGVFNGYGRANKGSYRRFGHRWLWIGSLLWRVVLQRRVPSWLLFATACVLVKRRRWNAVVFHDLKLSVSVVFLGTNVRCCMSTELDNIALLN
jgi:hypothetical protein